MYRPNSLWTWSFLAVSVVQAVIALALEGYVFAQFQLDLQGDWKKSAPGNGGSQVRSIPTYLSLLIFGFVYQLVLVYDALANKNTIQVIGLCFMNLGILVYTAIQIDQVKDATGVLVASNFIPITYWPTVQPYLIALPCIIALGTVLLSGIAWKLYDEFAWTIYKQISADLRLKRRYLVYQIYIAILKFDFFLFLGFEVQFLVIVQGTKNVEFYLTLATIPITILVLLVAAYCTKRENAIGMIMTILVYFAALAYFIFKLVRIYSSDTKRREEYKPAARTLTVFAAIAIILMIITIVVAIACTLNFNKGLKPHVSSHGKHQADAHDKLYGMGDVQSGASHHHADLGGHLGQGSRMEID